MHRTLLLLALANSASAALAQDGAPPRDRVIEAFERDADYAQDGFAFTAALTLRVRGLGRDVTGAGRADYDPGKPKGERWTVHEVSATNTDGSEFEDDEERDKALKVIRDGFGEGLVNVGIVLRQQADRITAVEKTEPNAYAFRFEPAEDAGKGARRSAENTRWTARLADGCIIDIGSVLEESFKPSIAARIKRADNRLQYACSMDEPAYMTRFSSKTEGSAVGRDFLSHLDVAYSDVRYIGPPSEDETAPIAAAADDGR